LLCFEKRRSTACLSSGAYLLLWPSECEKWPSQSELTPSPSSPTPLLSHGKGDTTAKSDFPQRRLVPSPGVNWPLLFSPKQGMLLEARSGGAAAFVPFLGKKKIAGTSGCLGRRWKRCTSRHQTSSAYFPILHWFAAQALLEQKVLSWQLIAFERFSLPQTCPITFWNLSNCHQQYQLAKISTV